MRAEVLLEERVDGRLEHEGVVDRDHADVWLAVPAGRAAASDTAVHDIVRYKEESLQELGHPSKCRGLEELLFAQGRFLQEGDGVGNRQASIAFSTDGVGIQRLDNVVSLVPGGLEHGINHTALYQSKAISGALYFFACPRISSTRVGKTDSNSLSVVVLAIATVMRRAPFELARRREHWTEIPNLKEKDGGVVLSQQQWGGVEGVGIGAASFDCVGRILTDALRHALIIVTALFLSNDCSKEYRDSTTNCGSWLYE